MTRPLVKRRQILDGANRYLDEAALVLELDRSALDAVPLERRVALHRAIGGPADAGRADGLDLAAAVAFACGQRGTTGTRGGRHGSVLALGWSDLDRVEVIADGVVAILELAVAGGEPDEVAALARRVAASLDGLPAGRRPDVVEPWFPVVGITGTNGKTTTTRLLAHLGRAAGHRVASCDTDGVHLDDEVLRTGDWSGPGGADVALHAEGATLGVLEIARGGLLRSGVGVSRLEVGVLLNVREDHLGEGGVDDLPTLARVKGAVIRAVGPGGTAVLNAGDPLVADCAVAGDDRRRRWFAVDAGALPGPGVTVIDGSISVVGGWASEPVGGPRTAAPGAQQAGASDPLLDLTEVPLTVGGASRAGIENALAGTAAALALGLDRAAIVEGLRTFGLDPADNRGRLERWAVDGRTVLHDLAHNPDGLRALLELARSLAGEGRLIALIGTAGDRRDEDLRALGRAAGEGADVVLTADKPGYLRDRDATELRRLLAEGAGAAGAQLAHLESEIEGVEAAWRASRPGDVVALCIHEQRDEVTAWLHQHGAVPLRA